MFDSERLMSHVRALVIASFVIFMYWIKEIMELLLRVIFGVDRRLMYVPVAQNTHAELPFLGSVRILQRGELFYYVFHATMSFAIASFGYIMSLYTPPPKPLFDYFN